MSVELCLTLPLDEDLRCGVCHDVLDQPTSGCGEGHVFCHRCLLRSLENRATCPAGCGQAVAKDKLVRSRPLENVIAKLQAKCVREAEAAAAACTWQGTLGELKEHRATSCPNEPVACANEGCARLMPRALVETHQRCLLYTSPSPRDS